VTLAQVLSAAGITEVTVVGFCTDYCVKATAIDAAELGLVVTVPLDLCAAVNPDTSVKAVEEMKHHGVITAHDGTS
jgi:nicotinamidase/pyrazinamidase